MAKNAFITGASGFIGSHLTNYLLDKKWNVRILLHKRGIPREKECDSIQGDIKDFNNLKSAFKGIDVVFHLAAALGASLINNEEFSSINASGTRNVLKAAEEAGVKKIIHFSSAGVIGSVKENEVASEDYPLNPIDIYDKTKLEGEQIALDFSKKGLDVTIIRPGWAYGPGDSRTFKLIKAIVEKKFILVTKGKKWQTPVYINDLISGIILTEEKGRKGEIYNLTGKEVLPVKDMVQTIASSAGRKLPPFYLPLFPVKIAAWIMGKVFKLIKKEAPLNMSKLGFFIHPKPLSIHKAQKELGYHPETSFEKGMRTTIEWYKKNGWI